jgi:hypothetical protein
VPRSARPAALAVVLALAGLVTACAPATGGGTPTDYSVCPATGPGQIQVAVVVDNAPTSTRVVCVVLPGGSDGLDALAARAVRINATPPRIEGGFTCGIDGTPAAPECAPAVEDGFRYWNYWNGGASWTSASVGAGDTVLTQGSVDGWVFGTWDFVTTFPQPPATASDFATLTN